MTSHTLVDCTHARHADAILDIINEAIVTSTALYDYRPRPQASMEAWFVAKDKGNFPVIGLEDEQGALAAVGSFGTFRAWPAYKYSVEHSVYVHKNHRGQGLGLQLTRALTEAARQRPETSNGHRPLPVSTPPGGTWLWLVHAPPHGLDALSDTSSIS